MALFTDPGVVSLDDLLQFESSLVDVCSSYGIDVQAKIKIATDGIGDRLMLWSASTSQQGLGTYTRNSTILSSVVVTPALHRWLCFESLSRVYSEAYNVQLNTRYQGKWSEYQKEAREAGRLVYSSGLGLVAQPLPRPAMPTVLIGTGASGLAALFVQATWVDHNNRESAPSAIAAVVLNGFSSVSVTLAENVSKAPKAAIGWNVYASDTPKNLGKQNAQPLPLAMDWVLPTAGLAIGELAMGGQTADFHVALSGLIQRG